MFRPEGELDGWGGGEFVGDMAGVREEALERSGGD